MFGLGRLGKLGSVGRAIAAWTPAQLWPLGASSPGMWIYKTKVGVCLA